MGTLQYTNIAGWKMDPDWADVFPLENGDIPASYVSFRVGPALNSHEHEKNPYY